MHPSAHGAPGTARLELAQIVRAHAPALLAHARLAGVQRRALAAIAHCRTAALGGEIHRCDRCGATHYVYHSCRNRHCPKCQSLARERWLAARRAELLPVPYFHLVFTLPHELNALAQGNARRIYGLLFAAASATLIEFGRNPRWLGGEIAATLVLHTWSQTLTQHLHIHALVAAGALSPEARWIHPRRGFSSRCRRSRRCSGRSSSRACTEPSAPGSSGSPRPAPRSPSQPRKAPGSRSFAPSPGWSTPRPLWPDPSRCSTTWAATCSAWPSPTSACSASRRVKCASPGATAPAVTAARRCVCPPSSSSRLPAARAAA
ncbi:MAG: transposase zinc-binding domain-containing protein [Burkholderiales bacterium]|nr:transposase zinc-binding domain-containing protein [Burkholderiales bacterium]